MPREIERKFLVNVSGLDANAQMYFLRNSYYTTWVEQGVFSDSSNNTVRVGTERVLKNRDGRDIVGYKSGYLTLKSGTGINRYEWETEIEVEDAEEMLALCQHTLEKTRHRIRIDGTIFEVDVFDGNGGLILAEVELSHEDEDFPKPAWLGKEVTDDPRYYNSYLVRHPFNEWLAQDV